MIKGTEATMHPSDFLPTICGKPPIQGCRTLARSDKVCRVEKALLAGMDVGQLRTCREPSVCRQPCMSVSEADLS